MFLPAQRYASAGISRHRASVCLSVTRRYCTKTLKRKITQTTPRDSPGTLGSWRQQSLEGDAPSPWNLRSNWPTRPISVHSAATATTGEKCSINTNRKSTTISSMSHRWTVDNPYVPQRVAQNAILLFLTVKFDFCRKKSAAKFLCVKTVRESTVATSLLYLTVHRWTAGDVPIHLKFAIKVTHHFRKRLFWQISLNSASSVKKS